jgi:hypothetical protein
MNTPYFLRSSKHRLSPTSPRISIPVSMTTAADALAAANAATAAITANDARIDAIEQGQTTIAAQLTTLTAQLQAFLTAGVGAGEGVGGGAGGGAGGGSGGASGGGSGGASGGGAGSSGVGGGAGGGGVVGSVAGHAVPHPRRRLDPSGMDKLHGDITISLLRSWRNRWNDFAELNQLLTYPVTEQMAAFRMLHDATGGRSGTGDHTSNRYDPRPSSRPHRGLHPCETQCGTRPSGV